MMTYIVMFIRNIYQQIYLRRWFSRKYFTIDENKNIETSRLPILISKK